MNSPLNTPTPQFGTAEYVGKPGGDHCYFCHTPIGSTYYRVKDVMTCPSCADKVRSTAGADTHAAFVRAALYGAGAAILGMVLYATFEIATGIIIGYLSLAVGWLVGKAMITGSKGTGGRRYQILAVVLTYAAVSTAAIPVWIHYAGEHRQSRPAAHHTQTEESSDNGDDLEGSAPPQQRPSPMMAVATLVALGLASPFLELSSEPVGGAIGLLILFVGMRFAWRFTAQRAPTVNGPFENTPQLSG